jgi:hypothetical protein
MSDDAYGDYMQSDAWKERRRAALERAVDRTSSLRLPRCEVCGRYGTRYKNRRSSLDSRERRFRVEGANGLHVHHVTYRNLGTEAPDELIVLCTDVAVWVESGYRDFSKRVGCHERAHDDPDFRREVERIARERRA